jgi:hypothetical protein
MLINGDSTNEISEGAEATESISPTSRPARRVWFFALSLTAVVYSLLAGLRTVTDWDLGWQLAMGRWVLQHHQIPSTDILSYTAQGQPWIYPVGSGLLFYLAYLAGQYTLLSWLGAAVCVGTVALLLRRGSAITAALAILATPQIALRSTPRAEVFTVVLFAAFLTLLWEQYETGRARLWLLPLLMAAWCNLHLGLVAGLAVIVWYVLAESLEMLWPGRRPAAIGRLRRAWPWFVATLGATLINPWGWGIYSNMFRFMSPMAQHASSIDEWDAARLNWAVIVSGLSLPHPNSLVVLLMVAAIAVAVALVQRQFGAAALLSGAAVLGVRHIRLQVLFSVVVVLVAGAVLASSLAFFQRAIQDSHIRSILAWSASCILVLLSCMWSADLITNRAYLGSTDFAEFGTGLGWWFPAGAAAFIQREKIPGEVFNNYNEGGYVAWSLGSTYRDYVDGRGDPFGDLVQRSSALMQSPPDSPEWQEESERYGINAVIVPLARYKGIRSFPVLRQFCSSNIWKPVYLDENSAVFVRNSSTNESLLSRLQIDCFTTPVPATNPARNDSKAFNQWANAAAVLEALGRDPEAFAATSRALAIFPQSGFVRYTRADLLERAGNSRDAEQQYLSAADIEPNELIWARLAKLYEAERRVEDAIYAWENVAKWASDPSFAVLSIGYDYLDENQPQEALKAFDRVDASLAVQAKSGAKIDQPLYANVAHGRAAAYEAIGDLKSAIRFEEQTVKLTPDRANDWMALSNLYSRVGRDADALRAREHATDSNSIRMEH